MPDLARRTVTITNRRGLHARASAKLQKLAGEYDCRLIVHHRGEAANVCSIMDLLMLGACVGTEIELEATGPDADSVVEAAAQLIAGKFGEGE